MKKTKKTQKRMMDGGMAATTKPAFNKGPAISTKPAYDKGPAISGRGGMKRMMDGGVATMDMPTRGNRPVPAGLMKQVAAANRPVGAGIAKRPPRGPFILPQYPNTIGTGNGPDYQSGYSESMKPGRGGMGTSSPYGSMDRNAIAAQMAAQKNSELSALSSMNNMRNNQPRDVEATASLASETGIGMKKGGAVKAKKMRGGGLARKGVGMALAKGGLAKRAGGCAKRGVGRGKIV